LGGASYCYSKNKKNFYTLQKLLPFALFSMPRLHASPPSPPMERSSSFTLHKTPYTTIHMDKSSYATQIDDKIPPKDVPEEELRPLKTNIHFHTSTGTNTCIICTFLIILLIYIDWAFLPDILEILDQQVKVNRIPSFTNKTQYFSSV
jgi:hypothetical protein